MSDGPWLHEIWYLWEHLYVPKYELYVHKYKQEFVCTSVLSISSNVHA